MDRLTAMQVFSEVAASGSFTATADKLEMSRAMVTRYVGELERWLGSRLLQRTTRSVTLTDAGEQCLRRSQQMLALVDAVQDETVSRDGALRGQLRVATSGSFGFSHLAPAIAEFLALHPQLKIDLNVSEGAVNLVEARIDLAIRISSEPDPMLVGRPLATCESVLVASAGYLAQNGTPPTPQGLMQHTCLSHANVGRSVWRLTRGSESVQVSVTSRFSANDSTILLHAALADGGIALVPNFLASQSLSSGALVQVLSDWQPPVMQIFALYPSRRNLSPAVRAMVDFLVIRFSERRW